MIRLTRLIPITEKGGDFHRQTLRIRALLTTSKGFDEFVTRFRKEFGGTDEKELRMVWDEWRG
jgi:hypothetical protein